MKDVTPYADRSPRNFTGIPRSRRKIDTVGRTKTEAARVYRRFADGELDQESFKTAIAGLKILADLIEKADLERRIDELERQLADARRGC